MAEPPTSVTDAPQLAPQLTSLLASLRTSKFASLRVSQLIALLRTPQLAPPLALLLAPLRSSSIAAFEEPRARAANFLGTRLMTDRAWRPTLPGPGADTGVDGRRSRPLCATP